MEDARLKRSAEEMAAIKKIEDKYTVILSDTIRNVFVDDITKEVKHTIDLEEFSNPENFNKFFCGGVLALYRLYIDLIGVDTKNPSISVLDFLHILLQLVVNKNIELATEEAIEKYKKQHSESEGGETDGKQ